MMKEGQNKDGVRLEHIGDPIIFQDMELVWGIEWLCAIRFWLAQRSEAQSWLLACKVWKIIIELFRLENTLKIVESNC